MVQMGESEFVALQQQQSKLPIVLQATMSAQVCGGWVGGQQAQGTGVKPQVSTPARSSPEPTREKGLPKGNHYIPHVSLLKAQRQTPFEK